MAGRKRRYRSKGPAPSTATYTQKLILQGASTADGATALHTVAFEDIKNTSGETVNRKIVRVTGSLQYAANPSAGKAVWGMFALRAAPELDPWPSVADFDPFNSGPGGSDTAYKGRPSPRPFARRNFIHFVQTGGSATQLFEQFMLRSKAERLLRPGWQLSAGLYVAGDAVINVGVAGLIRVVVEG